MRLSLFTYSWCLVITILINYANGSNQTVLTTATPEVSNSTVQTQNFSTDPTNISDGPEISTVNSVVNPILDVTFESSEEFSSSSESAETENSRAFSPIIESFWDSASHHLARGIRKLRESLHEGVKVAALIREDVDEGMSHLKGKSLFSDKEDVENQIKDENSMEQRDGMVHGILRFMGVDSNHLGIIALNVLIMFAEWITSSFVSGGMRSTFGSSRALRTDLLQWAIKGHNAKIDEMINEVKSDTLPEKMIAKLANETGNNTSCVQLLVCRMSPVIRGMQKTVDQSVNEGRGLSFSIWNQVVDTLYTYLPSRTDFVELGEECEKRFPACQLLKFKDVSV